MSNVTPTSSVRRHILRIFSGPLACALVFALPSPEGLDPRGVKCVAAAIWIILWWMTDAFPIALTSLFGLLLYAMMGVLPLVKGFAFFGNPSIILLLGAMLLLGVWKESNLIARYAYWAVTMPWVDGRPMRLLAVFGIAAGLLSALVPNIPVAMLFVSIAVAMAKGMKVEQGQPLLRALCLSSGVASALGGAGTPIGGAPNLVVVGVISSSLGYQIQFWEWTALGLPMSIGWLVVMVFLCWFFFIRHGCAFSPRDDGNTCVPLDSVMERMRALGPVTRHEHIAMAVMLLALLLWSFGPPAARALGLPELAGLLGAPFVAVLAGMSLFFIPLKKNDATGNITFAMNWKQGLSAINWDIIIFVTGALAFGQMLIDGSVDKWLAGLIGGMLEGMSPTMIWLILMTVSGLVSQCFSNVAVISLLLPVTAALAQRYGLNPVVTCLTVGMVANVGIMFPFSSPPTAATLMEAEGYVSARDFLRFSLPMLILASLIAMLTGVTLGALVFPMPA